MRKEETLYLMIANRLKDSIINGTYPLGIMIPTEKELGKIFDVSKITIRKAVEELAYENYVEKRPGRGTKVMSNRPYNCLKKKKHLQMF